MAAELKVLLVGNYAKDRQHSMLGFGEALAQGLPCHGVQADFIAPWQVLRSPTPRLNKWLAYGDKYILFPRHLRRAARRADVVHVLDQGNGIYVNHLQKVRHLVTVHDLLAIRSALGELPYWQTGPSGKLYQRAILSGLRKSNFVVSVSRATQRDVDRLLAIPPDRQATIPNGLFGEWHPTQSAPATAACQAAGLAVGEPYILNLGQPSPYKNRRGAMGVFAALASALQPMRMVLAGKRLSLAEGAFVQSSGLPHLFIEVNHPSHNDIEWLYSNARALLVASHDEGFGLPIIEAQACGCPVIIPNKEPMTDVAGGGAVRIDPAAPQAAARSIAEALEHPADLVARGYANAEKYRGGGMAAGYAGIYEALASEGVSASRPFAPARLLIPVAGSGKFGYN